MTDVTKPLTQIHAHADQSGNLPAQPIQQHPLAGHWNMTGDRVAADHVAGAFDGMVVGGSSFMAFDRV